jgi:hypothetical protein
MFHDKFVKQLDPEIEADAFRDENLKWFAHRGGF